MRNPLACCGSSVTMPYSTELPFGEQLTIVCSVSAHVLQQSALSNWKHKSVRYSWLVLVSVCPLVCTVSRCTATYPPFVVELVKLKTGNYLRPIVRDRLTDVLTEDSRKVGRAVGRPKQSAADWACVASRGLHLGVSVSVIPGCCRWKGNNNGGCFQDYERAFCRERVARLQW